MNRCLVFWCWFWCWIWCYGLSGASAANEMIELSLVPENGVPGQLRRLEVDVFTDRWFLGAPSLPEIEIDGAIVVTPQSFAMNFSQRKEGRNYAVQRHTYLVFPQRRGAFLLKPVEVELILPGSDGISKVRRKIESAQLGFVTKVSPSMTAGPILVASALNLTERYSSEQSLSVGDVLTRRIEIEAADTLAMFLPRIGLPKIALSDTQKEVEQLIPGGRLYQTLTELGDTHNRGRLRAKRVESWRYVFEQAGSYILPPLRVDYWDSGLKQWQSAHLSEKTIVVRGGAGLNAEVGAGQTRLFDWRVLGLYGLYTLLVLLVLTVVFYGLSIGLKSFRDTELAAWIMLCLTKPTAEQWPAVYHRWLNHYPVLDINTRPPAPLMRHLTLCYDQAESQNLPSVSIRVLLASLIRYRRSLTGKHTVHGSKPLDLPSLNPS